MTRWVKPFNKHLTSNPVVMKLPSGFDFDCWLTRWLVQPFLFQRLCAFKLLEMISCRDSLQWLHGLDDGGCCLWLCTSHNTCLGHKFWSCLPFRMIFLTKSWVSCGSRKPRHYLWKFTFFSLKLFFSRASVISMVLTVPRWAWGGRISLQIYESLADRRVESVSVMQHKSKHTF